MKALIPQGLIGRPNYFGLLNNSMTLIICESFRQIGEMACVTSAWSSRGQTLKIQEFLKQYRLHLGGSSRIFGSIDSTMRCTLKLIDAAVVLECECLTLAQHIFSSFPTWEKKQAEVIM